MPSPTQHKGAREEARAEAILSRLGYVVVERNWRGGGGEVDRIAWLDGLLCFVEVRSRVGFHGGSPEASIGWRKRRRLVRAAEAYLCRFSPRRLPMVRFDVVSIVLAEGYDDAPAQVLVIPNAFDADGNP